jgi:uncharacterized protein (TIGR00369 family)
MMGIDLQPPAGFERHFRQSPLTDPWEPLWSCWTDEAFLLGVHVAQPHCNARGMAHGGLISALADNAMGIACVIAAGGSAAGAVTASLTTDFLGSAKTGQWLQVAARATRVGGTLGFADAVVTADGEMVARASAVFRMLGQ